MRKVLLKRVRALVERFANDLTDVVVSRVEADLAHVGEILEYSLSAIASDLGHAFTSPEETNGDSDRGDHDPVPRVRRSARRGLRNDATRDGGRADSSVRAGSDAKLAQAPNPRREEGQRAPRLVADEPQPGTLRVRSVQGQVVQVYRPDTRPDKQALTKDGKRPPTCSKCGFVGGRATGCGTAHETLSHKEVPHGAAGPVRSVASPWAAPAAPLTRRAPIADRDAEPMTAITPTRTVKPTPEALAAARQRSKERLARLAERDRAAKASARRATEPALHEYDPDNLRPGLADPDGRYELPEPIFTCDSAGFPRGGDGG